jgi:outer membrane protein assembly factor BamB
MNKHNLARLLILSALAALAACGGDNDKIGSTVKGTRIAVIEEAKTLTADKDLQKTKPDLPRPIINLSWPQAGYDSEHSIPYTELSPHLHILWKQNIGEGSDTDFKLLAQPVVDHGIVYTMDAQGLVTSTNARTGGQIWSLDTTPRDREEKAIGGGLAIDGHALYVTTGFGDVLALNAGTGVVKWRKSLLKPLRAAPTVANNHIYVVSIDNDLNALDSATGDVLWHHAGIAESATLMGASSATVSGDDIIIAYTSGEIYNLRAQNGRVSWDYSLTSPTQAGALPAIADIRGLPVVDHDRVYAISHDGRMVSIVQSSGDRAWEADVGGIDTPIVAGDTVFVYGGGEQLMALERDTGRAMWVKPLQKLADPNDKDSDPIFWSGPLLAGERLWMVNSLGQLASFSPNDGSSIDTFDLGSPVYLPPIVADRTMFIIADDGTLIALR